MTQMSWSLSEVIAFCRSAGKRLQFKSKEEYDFLICFGVDVSFTFAFD